MRINQNGLLNNLGLTRLTRMIRRVGGILISITECSLDYLNVAKLLLVVSGSLLKLDSFGFPLVASKVPNNEGINGWIILLLFLVKVKSGDLSFSMFLEFDSSCSDLFQKVFQRFALLFASSSSW